jgi:hypothetical protein
VLDQAYDRHRLHTIVTRVNAEISEQILTDRHALDDEPEQFVTADEWLTAHTDALADDERAHPITEDDVVDTDLVDVHDTVRDAVRDAADVDPRGVPVDTAARDAVEPDLREAAAAEPRQTREDETRVPDGDEIRRSTELSRRILHEITAREVYDHQHEEEERAARLALWHHDDHNDGAHDTDGYDDAGFGGDALTRED